MTQDKSYTTEEIANLLRISKLTVYDLIKKGELPAYRVGRQMRVDAADLESYKARAKGAYSRQPAAPPVSYMAHSVPQEQPPATTRNIIISGQDISLDLLANELEKQEDSFRALRSYVGSINSLIAMYRGEADVVSTHLYDGDTEEYNVPYVRRLLSGHSYLMVNLVARWAGFYVQKGNPRKLGSWEDLKKPGIIMVNREKGSGARTLIEEKLRQHSITGREIVGYDREEKNHLAVAGAVARLEADVGVGIEKASLMVGVDFIPLIRERYDLVIMKKKENEMLIRKIREILSSTSFRQALEAIGGYDLTHTGEVMYETP
ncbi:helix-turn-helix transcriptional regulator [Brevibacillus panacihumi]|uniref:Helix-turn-helix domain-containing protein n=1 Tax=Brevibacillus panacihumi TaxID=497735 RepID=A0A3M8CHN8_9BACL|nr:helix-turn-helix transcriptional regulator [Brevibacillus panacihumi]RNB75043.1 helix-turn-helix domain-containing protein [Brevibacillus panacihumi]